MPYSNEMLYVNVTKYLELHDAYNWIENYDKIINLSLCSITIFYPAYVCADSVKQMEKQDSAKNMFSTPY